jgi:hypothetical protein
MHVGSVGAMSSPTAKLLHYPVPRTTIPDFADIVRPLSAPS